MDHWSISSDMGGKTFITLRMTRGVGDPVTSYEQTNAQRILAVTIGGLGDAILFSPVLKALRSRYPHAQIELLVATPLAQEAFTPSSYVDRISVVNMNRDSYLAKTAQILPFAIRSRFSGGSDICVIATGLNPKLAVLLRLVAGIRNIIRAPIPPTYATDLACNVALARRFDDNISESDVFLPLTEESPVEAKEVLERHSISWDENRIIAVYPSTDLWHRPRWELPDLAQVIRRLRTIGFQGKIVVVGSPEEGKEWASIDTEGVADANLAGELSILGIASLLSRCCLTIGSDGGLMHVAGAVGCPLVVVMTNAPLPYTPPGQKTRVIHSSLSCCTSLYPKRPKSCKTAQCKGDITVEEVLQACMDMLSVSQD